MKICDVTQFYSPRSGGVRRYLMEKRKFVVECTQDDHYLIVPGAVTERIDEGRLHCITIASPRIDRTSRYRILFNTRAIREFIQDIRPDVIGGWRPVSSGLGLDSVGEGNGHPGLRFLPFAFPRGLSAHG